VSERELVPDDTGSDTFSRYLYQAHVAFPFCMACVIEDDIKSVVLEHIEDIAVESAQGWRLLQVKTRDPERGFWTMSDLTKQGSGPFRSLYRSYKSGLNPHGTLEMHLQGFLSRKSICSSLRTTEGRNNPDLILAIKNDLGIATIEECQAFLSKVKVVEGLPSIDSIISQNLRLLGDFADHLQVRTIVNVYESVISRIENAMTAGKLDVSWWNIVLGDSTPPAAVVDDFRRKQLTRDELEPLFAPIKAPARELLSRLTAADSERPSLLVQKLHRGGASDDIVRIAKSLRASAAARESVNMALTSIDDDSVLEDVCTRLQSHFVGIKGRYASHPAPANLIWADMMSLLATAGAHTDPYSKFNQDPHLLMGEVCQMADRCEVDWGIADE